MIGRKFPYVSVQYGTPSLGGSVDESEVTREIEAARRSGTVRIRESRLKELPSSIREITHLRSLTITGSSLSSLPAWLADLTQLETLDLDSNKFESFPAVIPRIRSLRELGLSDNQINDVPPEIGELKNLVALALPGNNIRRLPPSLGQLRNLRLLDAGKNHLSSLPESISELGELTQLWLWGNNFSEIPAVLRTLKKLQVIDFSSEGTQNRRRIEGQYVPRAGVGGGEFFVTRLIGRNASHRDGYIKEIPDWLPLAFPDLQVLYLGGQKIVTLPNSFTQLKRLSVLDLSSNTIKDFPRPVLALQNLRDLDLHANSIRTLPVELEQLRKLTFLDLAENPIPIPPEILERPDPEAIIDFSSRVTQETRPLNEAKLLIVGEGSVGKTSLVNRLTQNSYDENEDKTEGIDVTRWKGLLSDHEITLNVWDFGGQEIMHATHQFFLTKRSVYVLVIDARQGEEQNRIEYWLKLIQSFSDNSPVIIVGNKADQAKLDIDRRGLKAKYDNIIGIVSVSCRKGTGITGVKQVLARAVAQLSNVRDLVPTAFLDVKQYLELLDVNYVSYSDYEKICRDKRILSKSSQELLINLLHDLGTVICFRDDPRLADTNILSPSWVTGGVYRLLNSNLAAQRKGLLTWEEINQILESDDYPIERRFFIVEMMKKFELCFESDETFLFPDLLTKEEPDTGVWSDVLHFEVKYDVLPSSVISRLIVRMRTLISKGTAWRTGVVLRLDRNRALVKGDREDSVVTIDVSGPQQRRRELLTVIRSELRSIERTIPGLIGEERVPVPGHRGIWVPYSHLLDLESAGRMAVIPQGLTEEFPIRDLLGGVETPESRESGQLAPPRNVRNTKNGNSSESGGDAQPWTVQQSIALGAFLLGAVIVVLAASVVTDKLVDPGAAAAAGVLALVVTIIVGLFILRSSGRISERGLLSGMKQALSSIDRSGGSKLSDRLLDDLAGETRNGGPGLPQAHRDELGPGRRRPATATRRRGCRVCAGSAPA
jgi:internalin A